MNPERTLSKKRNETASTRDCSLMRLFRSNLKLPGDSLAIQEETANRKESGTINKLSFSSSMASFGSSLLSSQGPIGQEPASVQQRPDFAMVERLVAGDAGSALKDLASRSDEELKVRLDKDRSLLMYATARSDSLVLVGLLKRLPELASRSDQDGRTALHYAVAFANLEAVLALAGIKALTNAADCQLQTPAHLAALKDRPDIFLGLLAKGSDIAVHDSYGRSPLSYLKDGKLKQDLILKLLVTDDFLDSSDQKRCAELKKSLLNRVNLRKRKCPWQALRKTEDVQEILQHDKELPQEDINSQDQFIPESIFIKSCQINNKQAWIIEDVLGVGNFGTVFLGKKADSEKLLAIKEYSKRQIRAPELTKRIFEEKQASIEFNSKFIVKSYDFFQTEKKLYMTMDYFPKRDLGKVLQFRGPLIENEIKILAAELILALEVIHSHGYVHRDLKPDNVFITSTGHIVIGDFGLCRKIKSKSELFSTFCGTLCYLPPEIMNKVQYGRTIDWYLLGELLFECAFGAPPFYHHCASRMRSLISACELRFPSNHTFSSSFVNLMEKLIVKDPSKRLGYKFGSRELKRHHFFLGVDWQKVARHQVALFDPGTLEDFKPKSEGRLLHAQPPHETSPGHFTLAGWSD